MTDRRLAVWSVPLFTVMAACAPYEPIDDATLSCDLRIGEARVEVLPGDPPAIDWDGEVWAVAITSPGAEIGAWGRIYSGRMYWQVAASEMGDELAPPVDYGVRPIGARDYTTFGGGWLEDLEPGRCYEVQLSDPGHGRFSRYQFRAE